MAGEIRKQPFLGSTFYVADMVEPELDAFTYTFVGQATLNGRQCTLVQSVPKNPKAAVYGKSVMALDPKDSIVLRREFFDADGRLLKVWSVDKVEKIDGHWTLMDHKMTNVQEQTQSRLQVDSIRYNADLADSIFTPKYLVR